MVKYLHAAISIALAQAAGLIGSIFTAPAIDSWYGTLIKPELTPPAWVFGPVWILLYTLMGIAAYLVWRTHPQFLRNPRMQRLWRLALSMYAVQLVLNMLWSAIFFGMPDLAVGGVNHIGLAFLEIVALWLAIVATIVSFFKISRMAALLLLPYLLWVSFAGYLNYSIWILNV